MRHLAWRIGLQGCSSSERAELKVANAHHRYRTSLTVFRSPTLINRLVSSYDYSHSTISERCIAYKWGTDSAIGQLNAKAQPP